MKIEARNTLDNATIVKINELEAMVQTHDGTYHDIYLDNRFNFDQRMPAFLFAWVENYLIGFLSIYADNIEEAELSVIVHPTHRQQGVATALIEQAKEIIKSFRIADISYISERRFIEKTKYLQETYQIDWHETEYLMEAKEMVEQEYPEATIQVRKAVMTDARSIASFQAKAFESSFQEAMTYAEGSIGEDDHDIFVFLNQDEDIIGSSSVNTTAEYYYLFGLAVDPNYQGQGFGTQGIYQMMKQLSAEDKRPFRLSVEKENEHAKHLYQKNGFKVISEVVYLNE